MNKIPVIVEMLDDDENSIFLEAFSELPSSEVNMHINVLGRGLYEYASPPTTKWKDINVDFVNSITKKQADWLLQWSYSFFTVFGVRKNIRITPKDKNLEYINKTKWKSVRKFGDKIIILKSKKEIDKFIKKLK